MKFRNHRFVSSSTSFHKYKVDLMLTNFLKLSTLFCDNTFRYLQNKEKHIFKSQGSSIFKGGIKMWDLLKEISTMELWSYRKPQEVASFAASPPGRRQRCPEQGPAWVCGSNLIIPHDNSRLQTIKDPFDSTIGRSPSSRV